MYDSPELDHLLRRDRKKMESRCMIRLN